jgi:hypothetical protein
MSSRQAGLLRRGRRGGIAGRPAILSMVLGKFYNFTCHKTDIFSGHQFFQMYLTDIIEKVDMDQAGMFIAKF